MDISYYRPPRATSAACVLYSGLPPAKPSIPSPPPLFSPLTGCDVLSSAGGLRVAVETRSEVQPKVAALPRPHSQSVCGLCCLFSSSAFVGFRSSAVLDSRWMLEPSEWTTAHEAIRIRAERRDRQVRGRHRATAPRTPSCLGSYATGRSAHASVWLGVRTYERRCVVSCRVVFRVHRCRCPAPGMTPDRRQAEWNRPRGCAHANMPRGHPCR